MHPYWTDTYSNYLYGLKSSHSIIDPHQLFSSQSNPRFTPELSGIHTILTTWGFKSILDISYTSFLLSVFILAISSLSYIYKYSKACISYSSVGIISILWSGHLMHVSLPIESGCYPSPEHLSLACGMDRSTTSTSLGDVCHHHLALGIVLCIYDIIYINIITTRWDVINVFRYKARLRLNLGSNFNLWLSIILILTSLMSGLTSQQLSTLAVYPQISSNYLISTTLYMHHIWISCLLFTGSISHLGIFITSSNPSNPYIYSILSHKHSILSTLSWLSLFLGFHTLLIYVHNDTLIAFGIPSKQLSVEPSWVQILHGRSGKLSTSAISTYGAW